MVAHARESGFGHAHHAVAWSGQARRHDASEPYRHAARDDPDLPPSVDVGPGRRQPRPHAAAQRRAADRRRVHHGRHNPLSVAEALAGQPALDLDDDGDDDTVVSDRQVGPITVTGDGPLVVREKTHPATPMTLDQALYEMELVGHDFYLFVDKESERPSVVYRRRGYDYGVISLEVESE